MLKDKNDYKLKTDIQFVQSMIIKSFKSSSLKLSIYIHIDINVE